MLFIVIFIKNILFFLGISFFGWQLCKFFLKEVSKFFLGILAISSGISLYVFLVNVISYIIKPPVSFWISFAILFITGIVLLLYSWRKSIQNNYQLVNIKIKKKIIVTALIVTLVTGFVALRTLERDDYTPNHILSASLISAGNFPPLNSIAPSAILLYHYAPDLLSAALHHMTGVPFWLAYDIQTAIFTGLIFLLSWLVVFRLVNNEKIAFMASLGMMYAGSLHYWLVIPFLSTLYKKFILGVNIEYPFMLLPKIVEGEFNRPLVNQVLSHTPSFGLLIILLVIYLWQSFYKQKISWIVFGLLGGILFGWLALIQETSFVVIWLVCVLLVFFTTKKINTSVLLGWILFLSLSMVIALVQGGLLTHLSLVLPLFSFVPKAIDGVNTGNILANPAYQLTFSELFEEFGLLLILFLLAIRYLNNKIIKVFLTFIVALSLSAFIIPWVVNYLYPGELARFLYLGSIFMSWLVSIYLSSLFFSAPIHRWKKILVIITFFAIIMEGVMFQTLYSLFPLGKLSLKPQPIFAIYLENPTSKIEEKTKEWIHKETSIKDWFFAVDLNGKYAMNYRFITLYGRFAPTYHIELSSPANTWEAVYYQRLIKSCSADDLKALKYRYIFVNNLWPRGLEAVCEKNNNLTLVYKNEGIDEFVKIYKINL